MIYIFRGSVKALVRWATGKRVPNRPLPKLSLITLHNTPPPWNGGMFKFRPNIRVDVVTNSRFQFLGTQGGYFSGLTWGSSTFLEKKACYGEWRNSNSRPETHILPSTPFYKALVLSVVIGKSHTRTRWATGKKLTDRLLPKLRLQTADRFLIMIMIYLICPR